MIEAQTIDDPDDPRIAGYRDIRERDLVGRQGGFILEGEVVLRAFIRGGRGHRLGSVLLADRRVEPMAELLEQLPEGTPVYRAGQAVIDQIAGFHLHRGVLGLGGAAPPRPAEALLDDLGERALVVVLFGIANHDNMGGVFRNAAAFGADAVLLDPACCDPLYRKAIRVSVGGVLTTPFARLRAGEDAIGLLAARGFETVALSPGGAAPLHSVVPTKRTAVLLGAEGPGLPAEILARATGVAIPMAGAFDSLNVATTSGIVLHHLVFGGER